MQFVDDGATAGNSLENNFPEYLPVTLSRCVGRQESHQMFVPSEHFIILKRAKNRRGPSQVNKVDGPFCNGFLSQELSKS
jgi:hypothetical protein